MLAALFLAAPLGAQKPISVEELKRNFESDYRGKQVSVRGVVSAEKRVWSLTSPGYYLKDRRGSLILVRTGDELPAPTLELTVTGIAGRDADGEEIYVSEKKREVVQSEVPSRSSSPSPVRKKRAPPPAARKPPPTAEQPKEEPSHFQWPDLHDERLPWAAGTAGALALLVLLLVVLRRQKKAEPAGDNRRLRRPPERRTARAELPADSERRTQEPPDRRQPAPDSTAGPAPAAASIDDFANVKVYRTTKILPGKLILLSSGQETDILYLSDQSGTGEIEIGRESPDVKGGIRIKDKTHTLSRRQARMVYSSRTKEFLLINLARDTSNPTTLNGRRMSENEAVVLKDDDVLGMGNFQLKFRQD